MFSFERFDFAYVVLLCAFELVCEVFDLVLKFFLSEAVRVELAVAGFIDFGCFLEFCSYLRKFLL